MTGNNRQPRTNRLPALIPAMPVVVLSFFMLLAAGPAHALGLGQATVRSYLNQPLDVRIELISRSEAEMATVTAGIASPADFQVMGLSRSAIGAPLEFTVHRGLDDPHIQVTSRAPIQEPVVQLVVEVVWSSGRMLRQYTLFLDPPTFQAPAPLPATPARSEAPAPASATDRAGQASPPVPGVTDSGPPFRPSPEPSDEQFSEVPSDVSAPARDLVIEESGGGDSIDGTEEDAERTASDPSASPDGTGAPMRAILPEAGQALPSSLETRDGDTLWNLSRRYAEQSGVSINQVMLAVQQKNPDAFIGDNINVMLSGQVLRMPDREEVLSIDAREAMLEVMRQEERYRTRQDVPASPDQLPTVDNLAAAPGDEPLESVPVDEAPGDLTGDIPEIGSDEAPDIALDEAPGAAAEATQEVAEADSRLQLVPPAEADDEETLGQGNSAPAVSTGESAVEELARTQEELANARQENVYLEERIAELEAELARREAASTEGVADTNLAEMEQRLREERQAGEPEPAIDLTPAEDAPDSWLARNVWWLLGGAVVVVAALLVVLHRRRTAGVLEDDSEAPVAEPPEDVERDEPGGIDQAAPDGPAPALEAEFVPVSSSPVRSAASGSEAVELDVNDPETRLDLARAYLAMGKPEKVKDLLEKVIEEGSEDQAREARAMLREL